MSEMTKISISKELHEIAKKICQDKGFKMYHFEDEAVLAYIKANYPEYMEKK